MKIKTSHIEAALSLFDAGKRPDGYKQPKRWYVSNKTGKCYPAKAIWSLATGIKLSYFNTRDARLGLSDLDYLVINIDDIKTELSFDEDVDKSKNDTVENRRIRLKNASKKPAILFSIIKGYNRNPDVIAETLYQANGTCGRCKNEAPFKKKNGEAYLEVHHIIPLRDGGEDTIENTIALCPNCHRELHFGQ